MSVKMRINVTKQNIMDARFCSINTTPIPGQNCAIAKSVMSIFPKTTVGTEELYFWKDIYQPGGGNINVSSSILPIEAIEFISDFDNSIPEEREKMEPFSFEIDVPDIIIDEISIEELKEALKGYPSMELV